MAVATAVVGHQVVILQIIGVGVEKLLAHGAEQKFLWAVVVVPAMPIMVLLRLTMVVTEVVLFLSGQTI